MKLFIDKDLDNNGNFYYAGYLRDANGNCFAIIKFMEICLEPEVLTDLLETSAQVVGHG